MDGANLRGRLIRHIKAADMTTHAITTLRLSDFRNHASLTLALNAGCVVLQGHNGAGKTNILEAISLLAPGRGLRHASLRMMDREGGGPWAVHAQLTTPSGPVTLATGRDPQSPRDSRIVKADGERLRSHAALTQYCAIQWLTPDMDQLWLQGGTARRKLLDRLTGSFMPEHAGHVARYESALRERNRVLAEPPPWDAHWLAAIESQLSAHGVAIAAARLEALRYIAVPLAAPPAHFPGARMALSGFVEDRLAGGHTAIAAESDLQSALADARTQDARRGRASHGPHRSDWQVTHLPREALVETCSTGEQKAVMLSLLLAAASARAQWCGAPPIVLLDEAIAHLDRERRESFFALIAQSDIQVWLSGTDASDFAPLQPQAQIVTLGA